MGGNFVMAAPDTALTFEAMKKCDLTAHVSTKLNRSHLVHGREALILPCIGRTEVDLQASGPQRISVEDSMSMVHLSVGMREPASEHLRSEPAIVAGIAKASLPSTKTPWDEWIGNYDRIRDKMAEAIEGFEDFNRRANQPLGFRLRQPARELVFLTDTKKANFSSIPMPDTLPPPGKLSLGTLRSHDQWNTTIYSDDDRYRGVKNLRTLLFMNEADMQERGIRHLHLVNITSFAKDGKTRSVQGYRAVKYDIARGCAAGYMPELNVLCPLGDFSPASDQPIMKHLVVEVHPSGALGTGGTT
jgi:anaerobic selenocysteine-containing dehydrogenase